jgi:hypothetical protein
VVYRDDVLSVINVRYNAYCVDNTIILCRWNLQYGNYTLFETLSVSVIEIITMELTTNESNGFIETKPDIIYCN